MPVRLFEDEGAVADSDISVPRSLSRAYEDIFESPVSAITSIRDEWLWDRVCCGTGFLTRSGPQGRSFLVLLRPPSFARLDGSETRPYTIIFNNLDPSNPLFPHSTPIFTPSLPFAWPSRYGSITST